VLCLTLSACSPSPPPPYGETEEFRAWRGKAAIPIPAAGFATRIDGSVEFDLGDRECTPNDWIEVVYNGDILRRMYIHVPEGQPPRTLKVDLRLMTGPVNRLSFFDTVTNTGYNEPLDTRTPNGHKGDFVFKAVGRGFELHRLDE